MDSMKLQNRTLNFYDFYFRKEFIIELEKQLDSLFVELI